jgi:hypothetical protein
MCGLVLALPAIHDISHADIPTRHCFGTESLLAGWRFMANDQVILQGFPPIPRHWPSCFFGCTEAITQYQFAALPFADCDYDHTFYYERQPGGIGRAADGTNLDLKFESMPVDFDATFQRIRDARGFDYRLHHFFSAGEFESFALQTLRGGRALAVYFDWFYVAERREYRKIHAPHYMCLVGVGAGGGPVYLQDQYHGRLVIPGGEFGDFIEFSGQDGRDGAMFIELEQTDKVSVAPSSRLVELRRNIDFFLDNLESTDSRYGLAALQAFRDEVTAFMTVERAAPGVFYVPGMWQFSMQRAHFAEALKLIEKAHPEFSIPNRRELLHQLKVLHRCWFELNAEAETALIKNQPAKLAEAMARLDAIIAHERLMPRHLERLRRSLH